MDCKEFTKKRGSSSSSSGSEDEGIVGNDQPTRVKIVQRNDGDSMDSRENNSGGVVIIYNTEEAKQLSSHYNDIRSESQKSSGLSSQSRPSIYDEAQRADIYNSKNDGRHTGQNLPLRNPYFDSQKYRQKTYRNNYSRQNQGYQNNYPRQNIHYQNYRGQKRFNCYNDQWGNDYYHQHERNYEREGREERKNFRNYNNYRNQTKEDQRQNYYNGTQNYQRKNDQKYYNELQQEKQKYENHHQKQQQKKVSITSKPIRKVQKSRQNPQIIEKKSSIYKIPTSPKKDQKANNFNQEKPKLITTSQNKKKIQQKDSIPIQNFPKVEQKPLMKSPVLDVFTYENKKTQLKKEKADLSSNQSELNKGHSNIECQESFKSKDNKKVNLQEDQSSSGWDNQSNDSEEENKKNDKSSFECQQLQLQFPLPPLIPDNHHSLSDLHEDLSFLQELGVENKSSPQEKKKAQKIPEDRSNMLAKRDENDSFSNNYNQNEEKLFSQEQFQILRKMFDVLPVNQQSVFIELKIITSNVASFKIKNISSEVFNLKDELTKQIKNHPFIKIKQFQKSVPRDFLPLLIRTNGNEISGSKTSKLILAQIFYPLNLLEHYEKFVEKQQKAILRKIEKKKKVFEDVNELIGVDYITLRCSSCNHKKSFFWNNNLIPHQCNSNCPNILRFSIESMYIC